MFRHKPYWIFKFLLKYFPTNIYSCQYYTNLCTQLKVLTIQVPIFTNRYLEVLVYLTIYTYMYLLLLIHTDVLTDT